MNIPANHSQIHDTYAMIILQLLISFCELYDTSVLYNKNLILLESDVYFEPYHHVLKALIQFDDASFPMADYIIKNKVTCHLLWKYLLLISPSIFFRMQ